MDAVHLLRRGGRRYYLLEGSTRRGSFRHRAEIRALAEGAQGVERAALFGAEGAATDLLSATYTDGRKAEERVLRDGKPRIVYLRGEVLRPVILRGEGDSEAATGETEVWVLRGGKEGPRFEKRP